VALIGQVRVVLEVSVMEQIDIERSEMDNTKDWHILSGIMFAGASQFAGNHLTRLHTRPLNPNFLFHNHHTKFCEKFQLLEAKG
jgi:hypothetical protein